MKSNEQATSENLKTDFVHSDIQNVTLRRTGRKGVQFQGSQLVEALGSGDALQVTHDLNIYSTCSGRIVVQMIVRRGLDEQKDIYRVQKFDDLPAAAAWLESYRAGDDAPITADLAHAELALPWAVLQAVSLRQNMDRIERHYHCMLTEVFMALDLTDSADSMQDSSSKTNFKTAA